MILLNRSSFFLKVLRQPGQVSQRYVRLKRDNRQISSDRDDHRLKDETKRDCHRANVTAGPSVAFKHFFF